MCAHEALDGRVESVVIIKDERVEPLEDGFGTVGVDGPITVGVDPVEDLRNVLLDNGHPLDVPRLRSHHTFSHTRYACE